jgi:hypothetical protein
MICHLSPSSNGADRHSCMCAVRQRLSRGFHIACVILAIGATGLLVRGYFKPDRFYVVWTREYVILSSRGRLALLIAWSEGGLDKNPGVLRRASERFSWGRKAITVQQYLLSSEDVEDPGFACHHDIWLTGSQLLNLTRKPDGTYSHNHIAWSRTWLARIQVPLWAVACLFVLPLVRGVIMRLRYARRRKEGRCLICGYDLRASPERCPECGQALHPMDS